MSYCVDCGSELILKESINFGISDGLIPFCENCKEFKYPMFNCAVSCVLFNQDKTKILLIQQYGRNKNILVAGYVNKAETLEHALLREIKEEVGLEVKSFVFNASEYFEKSNSLICNFIVQADSEDFVISKEVDFAKWYALDDAIKEVMPDSLAERFLIKALEKEKCFRN